MTYIYCAICREKYEPDDTHAWVRIELKQIDDRNKTSEYSLCTDCYHDVKDEWGEPV